MAYDFEESSTQRIDDFVAHADYTTTVAVSFWLKAESNPGSHQAIFVSKDKDGANEPNIRMLWTPAGGGDVYTVTYAAGAFNEWKADYSPTVGAWEHWYFEVDWSTNPDTHRFWVNGVEQTMTHNFGSNNVTPSTTATQTITLGGDAVGDPNNADGVIAEVAFWSDNVGLARATMLSKGYSPLFFKNNLTEYIPLIRNLHNFKGGSGTLSVSNPTVAPHPRIYYPASYQIAPFFSGTNVTVTPDSLTTTSSLPTPTVTTTRSPTISAATLTFTSSLLVPTITTVRNVTISPSELGYTATINAPTVTAGSSDVSVNVPVQVIGPFKFIFVDGDLAMHLSGKNYIKI